MLDNRIMSVLCYRSHACLECSLCISSLPPSSAHAVAIHANVHTTSEWQQNFLFSSLFATLNQTLIQSKTPKAFPPP